MNNNIIPIKKADHFGVYLGDVTDNGEIVEGESVGIAFLKPGSKKFRLKLWVMPSHQYFVVPDEKSDTKYVVLSLEEYVLPTGEVKTSWNRIGKGNLVGSFIAIRIQLLAEPVYLCLFPDRNQSMEDALAA